MLANADLSAVQHARGEFQAAAETCGTVLALAQHQDPRRGPAADRNLIIPSALRQAAELQLGLVSAPAAVGLPNTDSHVAAMPERVIEQQSVTAVRVPCARLGRALLNESGYSYRWMGLHKAFVVCYRATTALHASSTAMPLPLPKRRQSCLRGPVRCCGPR